MAGKSSVLIISYIAPYPVTDGGKVSIFGTVNYLRNFFDITIVFPVKSKDESGGTEQLKTIWKNVNIDSYNRYRAPGMAKRIKAPFKKIYGPIKQRIKEMLGGKKKNKMRLNNPVEIIDKGFFEFIENVIRSRQFDIIQVEYTELLNLITILPHSSKRIFVQIENRYMILRDIFAAENKKLLYNDYIVENARVQEQAYMKLFDHVFALNKNDKVIMEEQMALSNVFVSPYPILDSMIRKNDSRNYKADKLLFIGSQSHYPNEDAVRWFVDTMYKEVNRQTGLKLYITGNWTKEFIKTCPAVDFTGFVDDLSELINNSIVISPIRIGGGGVRAKVIMAMAMRSPVISTSLCAEGLEELENGKNILLADTESAIINSIAKLVNEPLLGQHIIENASALIEKHYSEKAVGERRRKFYNSILEKN